VLVAALGSQSNRGRPPRYDIRRLDGAGKIISRTRVAWLLRVARLHGEDEHYRNLTKFSKELQSKGIDRISPSSVSRIETGHIAASFEVVRGYEDLLGRSPYSMVSVLDNTFRYRSTRFEAKPLLLRRRFDTQIAYRRFDELVARACSNELMSGAEWDELTVIVTERPDLVVSPRSAWMSLTDRLLTEEILADGVPWMIRFEAVNRLLAHPTIGIDALGILRATVDDRGVQSLVGTACLFDASEEPQASQEILRHIKDPADERIFKGTLMACVQKLKYSQFNEPQLRRLSDLVAAALLEPSHLDDETGALASSVLRQLPHQFHGSVGKKALANMSRERDRTAILDENRLKSKTGGLIIATRIANYAMARTPTMLEGYVDNVFPVLIDEMLFDPVFDARLYAAFLIYASPYRQATAEALAVELKSAQWSGDLAWITTIFEALRILGNQKERNRVEQYVTSPGIPIAIADVAAYALGHIDGSSTDEFWRRALAHHLTAWERSRSQAAHSILDRLIYAVGMAENDTVLRAAAGDVRMPTKVRASARWWLNQADIELQSAKR
jgi:hypothetical protein